MNRISANFTLYRLAAVAVAGHRFWLLPLLPLLWLAALAGATLIDLHDGDFAPQAAQGTLLGAPMTVLAVFLGLRIIAGEIDGRSLEIAYTVPGGCERVWRVKLVGAALLLIVAEALLAGVAWAFFTTFPVTALYGALQAAVFYLVLAMAMATLFRSEVAGAMVTVAVLGFNFLVTDGGDQQIRISPFWNPLAADSDDPAQVLAWTVQNRIGTALVIAAIVSLAFMRANRRERMLDG